jgi:transposase
MKVNFLDFESVKCRMSGYKGRRRDFELLEQRRMKAGRLFKRGLLPAEVARECDVSCQSATRWLASWKKGGMEALKKAPRAGRPPRLSEGDFAKLKSILSKGTNSDGAKGWGWTGARVAALIESRFGVQYHPDHVCRLLGQLGLNGRSSRRGDRRGHRVVSVQNAPDAVSDVNWIFLCFWLSWNCIGGLGGSRKLRRCGFLRGNDCVGLGKRSRMLFEASTVNRQDKQRAMVVATQGRTVFCCLFRGLSILRTSNPPPGFQLSSPFSALPGLSFFQFYDYRKSR